MSTDSVKVAVRCVIPKFYASNPLLFCRIRPQNVREQAASYQVCTIVSKTDAQIFIGSDKSFTYDYAFDREANQVDVYDACIRDLVDGVFNGLNATILAYGQVFSIFIYFKYVDNPFRRGPARRTQWERALKPI
jgi:kinesin family protein 4/21/27